MTQLVRSVAVGVVMATLLLVGGVSAGAATIPAATPGGAGFYSVPDVLPLGAPGAIIKTEAETAPAGMHGTVYRVMYHSRSVAGNDIPVTGLIAIPDGTAPAGGWPVVTWAHGTTGIADSCAPSKTLDFEGADFLVNLGYEVVATDYEGLGTPGRHPYIVGQSEGRGVLDIVRAARNLPQADASDRVVIWGHSQGGHAALWAGQIASTWAPELHVLGTVAGAPPSQLQFVYQALKTSFFRYYLLMAAAGINAAYPQAQLSQVLTPLALSKLGVVDTACGSDIGTPYTGLTTDQLIKVDPYSVEPWRSLIQAQEPGTVKTDNPIVIIQGGNDEQIPVPSTALLEVRMCGLGQVVSRRIYTGQSHAGVIPVADPEMAAWIHDRFAGLPAPNDCKPTAFLSAAAHDLLGHDLSAGQTRSALSQLGSPTDQAKKGVVLAPIASSAAAVSVTVGQAYQDLLGHPGTAADIAAQTARIVTGPTSMADVQATILAGRAFAATLPAGTAVTDADLVAAWYPKLLGRAASPADVAFWVSQVPAAGLGRVAATLAHSAEARRYRVGQLFRRFLGRPATAPEAHLYSTWLHSFGETSVIESLLESFEYDDLAQSR